MRPVFCSGGFALALFLSSTGCVAADSELPRCIHLGQSRLLLEKQGPVESLAFDRQGRLLFTNAFENSLKRLDRPDAKPIDVATGINHPGGIVVLNSNEAYVGTGNSLNGFFPSLGKGGIAHVDLKQGKVTPVVSGLSMANGLVRTQDGTFYASDDFAPKLDRVLPNGTVQQGWLDIPSNGLALSSDEKTLYVNQVLPAKVLAVNLASGEVRLVAKAPASRKLSVLDGLDIDRDGRLYIAAYLAGEVWRLEKDGKFCLLIDGLILPASVVAGRAGSGFEPTSVYVGTYSGKIYEIPNAVPSTSMSPAGL